MDPNNSSQPNQQEAPVPPQAPAQPTPYQQPAGQDPGQTLAIVGVVLAFVFSLAGLIVSIIAKNKSKSAGFKNTLATVGIVLNVISLVLGFILIAFYALLVLTAYHGIQARAQTSSMETTARSLDMKLEAYNAVKGNYPSSLAEFFSDTNSSDPYYVDPTIQKSVSTAPITANTNMEVALYICSDSSGNQYTRVDYWDITANKVAQAGSSLSDGTTPTCTILK